MKDGDGGINNFVCARQRPGARERHDQGVDSNRFKSIKKSDTRRQWARITFREEAGKSIAGFQACSTRQCRAQKQAGLEACDTLSCFRHTGSRVYGVDKGRNSGFIARL